jgi:hypothetical protein
MRIRAPQEAKTKKRGNLRRLGDANSFRAKQSFVFCRQNLKKKRSGPEPDQRA